VNLSIQYGIENHYGVAPGKHVGRPAELADINYPSWVTTLKRTGDLVR
jgi:hypothetical protein